MIETKSEDEIKKMRDSCKLAADTLLAVGELIKPGITGIDISNFIKYFTEKHGGICAPYMYKNNLNSEKPFPSYACVSPEFVVCHGIPNNKPLDGKIFNVDITTILNGAHGDTSAMFFLGEQTEEKIKLMKISKECLEIGINQVKNNVRIGDIGYEIEQYALLNNLYIVKEFCGHGIGIGLNGFHMFPNILHFGKKGSGLRLPKGLTHTIEPILTVSNEYSLLVDDKDFWTIHSEFISSQWEHTILINDNGFEILTERNGILQNSIEVI